DLRKLEGKPCQHRLGEAASPRRGGADCQPGTVGTLRAAVPHHVSHSHMEAVRNFCYSAQQNPENPIGRRVMVTDRRIFLSIMAGLLATPARAQAPAMSRITAFSFHFAGLKGGDIQLAEYARKPIPIVHTPSPCGSHPPNA